MTGMFNSLTEIRARFAVSIFLGTIVLCWPALYNGHPFLYPDSAAYIEIAASGSKPWSRSIYYGYLISPAHLEKSLWPVVFVQSLIAAHLIYLTFRTTSESVGPFAYLTAIVLLAALSPLPWYVGFVMPDIFGAYAVLALFLIGSVPRRLSRFEIAYLFCLAIAAIMTHHAYLVIALGTACVIVAMNSMWFGWRGLRTALLGAVLPSALAIGAIVVTNVVNHGVDRMAGYGQIFALARLQDDGPATAYLRDRCPEAGYKLCAYVDELPMWSNDFLWHPQSPLRKAGEPWQLADEASTIVRATILSRPLQTLETAIINTWDQILLISLRPARWSLEHHKWHYQTITERFPAEQQSLASARQQRRAVGLHVLEPLFQVAALASAILCLILLWPLLQRREQPVSALIAVVAAALMINAFVSGAISEPLPRYNGRMIWLIDLAAIVSVLWLGRQRRVFWRR